MSGHPLNTQQVVTVPKKRFAHDPYGFRSIPKEYRTSVPECTTFHDVYGFKCIPEACRTKYIPQEPPVPNITPMLSRFNRYSEITLAYAIQCKDHTMLTSAGVKLLHMTANQVRQSVAPNVPSATIRRSCRRVSRGAPCADVLLLFPLATSMEDMMLIITTLQSLPDFEGLVVTGRSEMHVGQTPDGSSEEGCCSLLRVLLEEEGLATGVRFYPPATSGSKMKWTMVVNGTDPYITKVRAVIEGRVFFNPATGHVEVDGADRWDLPNWGPPRPAAYRGPVNYVHFEPLENPFWE